MFRMKRAGLFFCALFLLLPVVQGIMVEDQITAGRSQPLRLCSPVVTIGIDAVATVFGGVFSLINRVPRQSAAQFSDISGIVNSLFGRVFGALGKFQRMSQGVSVQDIMPEELYKRLESGEDIVLIDVRLPTEYGQYHIDGALNIPLQDVVGFLKDGEIPHDKTLVFICKTGGRSYIAAMSALAQGIRKYTTFTTAWI